MDRLLIIGAGDVAWRALPWLRTRFRVVALVRGAETAARWRAGGALPVTGDLDVRASLTRLGGLADVLLWCAPPGESGDGDARLHRTLAVLAMAARLPRCIVYVSTSGVYGDCQGERVAETRPVCPQTLRARRRVAAERLLRNFSQRTGCAVRILRAPGIYAAERLPLARLARGDPVLCAEDDVVTNHIHADDMARAACFALFRGGALRVFNVCDDTPLPMADFYDALADVFVLPRPPRATRAECALRLSPMSLSFMGESRRLDNARICHELRWRPRFADVRGALVTLRGQVRPG